MTIMRAALSLFDWLCINDKQIFLFNEECGRTNLSFIIQTCNLILSQFRKPKDKNATMPTMEDVAFNDKENKKV